MGLSIISTDDSVILGLIRHGNIGCLLLSVDPTALADAIDCLLGDRKLAREFAVRGRELVLELCTEENRAARVERIYRELLSGKAGKHF